MFFFFLKKKNFCQKQAPKKISKNETRELYNNLMKPDVDVLKNALGKGKDQRNSILKGLNSIESSVFEGIYFYHKNLPKEKMFERSIEEGLKLRKEKTAEIEREEKNINKELFKRYFTNCTLLSLSDMYKKLCKAEGARNEN